MANRQNFKEGNKGTTTTTNRQTEFQAPSQFINTPCKYHKKGLCKLGQGCRFLHDTKQGRANTVNKPPTQAKTVCAQISKFGRRPFLHMVVLYASDDNVMNYSQEVFEEFLSAGIDVSMQTSVGSKPNNRKPRLKGVKTDHLAEIICTSHADFLIVIGDRNMRNKSCQAKRKGKLLEMEVADVIALIWKSWPQNPQKSMIRIQNLSDSQKASLLFQYCATKSVDEQLQYLKVTVDEILMIRQTQQSAITDEPMATKLLTLQKGSIRLHTQLKKSLELLEKLPLQVDQPELSSGLSKPLSYKPNAPRTPKNTIALPLVVYLIKFILDIMEYTEGILDNVQKSGHLTTPLWNTYLEQHTSEWKFESHLLDEMTKIITENNEAACGGSDMQRVYKDYGNDNNNNNNNNISNNNANNNNISNNNNNNNNNVNKEETISLGQTGSSDPTTFFTTGETFFSWDVGKSLKQDVIDEEKDLAEQYVTTSPRPPVTYSGSSHLSSSQFPQSNNMDLTLFPSNLYSPLPAQDPNYKKISQIWKQDDYYTHHYAPNGGSRSLALLQQQQLQLLQQQQQHQQQHQQQPQLSSFLSSSSVTPLTFNTYSNNSNHHNINNINAANNNINNINNNNNNNANQRSRAITPPGQFYLP